MRKKGLALLVSCCLLMALLPALAQGGAVLPPTAGNITSLAVHKGLILLTTEEGQVFALKEGESEPQALPWQLKGLRDILVFEGDQLYGLNLWAGELYPVSIEGERLEMGETIGLDFGHLSDQEAVHNISNAFVLGGQLYLVIAQTYSISMPSLLVVDTSTGKAQAHDIEGLMYATPYRDGQLVMTLRDQGRDEQTGRFKPSRLASYDLQSGAVEDMGELNYAFDGNVFPIAYEAEHDAIYILSHREVNRRNSDGSLTLSAYPPLLEASYAPAGKFILLPGLQTVLLSYNSFSRLSLDPALLPTQTLQLRGAMLGDLFQAAALKMPQAHVNTQHADFEEIQQLLLTADTQTDIFIISTDQYDPALLMRKGYCVDLAASEALSAYLAEVYPFIRDFVSPDGRPLMLPVDIELRCLSFEPKTFEAFSLPVPDSFVALCELLDGWQPDDHPGLVPMPMADYQRFLTQLALSIYADQVDAQGGEPSFKAEVLRQMLLTAQRTDTSDIPIQREFADEIALLQDMNTRLLMRDQSSLSPYGLTNLERYVNASLPLYLAPTATETAPVPAELKLMFINPRSQNIELALEYMAHCAASLKQETRIMLQPGYNVPVDNPNYASEMKGYEDMLAFARQRAAEAEGADKRIMEENLAAFEARMESIEQQTRYSVTPEAIARYREYMPRAFVRRYHVQQAIHNPDIQQLFERWLAGQMSLDQCLDEAENRLRLMRLESQ